MVKTKGLGTLFTGGRVNLLNSSGKITVICTGAFLSLKNVHTL